MVEPRAMPLPGAFFGRFPQPLREPGRPRTLGLQRFARLLAHQQRQCVLLAENASCASVSMPVLLRFNCTANRYSNCQRYCQKHQV